MDSLREAFFTLCEDARPAESHYVSLYVDEPFYGGPEEGGWWGADTKLVAHHEVGTAEDAERLAGRVRELASTMNEDALIAFNRQCAAEAAWLDARGLDDSFLPEVDGENRFWVTIEQVPGSENHEGDRYYS